MKSPVVVEVPLKIPFYDVDPMQIVWHGNYLKYFDIARQELFNAAELDLFNYSTESGYVFPVIRVDVKYVRPLRVNDECICSVFLKDTNVKIIMDFEIRLKDSGVICAQGRSQQAALRLPEMEMQFHIPEDVQKALWAIKREESGPL